MAPLQNFGATRFWEKLEGNPKGSVARNGKILQATHHPPRLEQTGKYVKFPQITHYLAQLENFGRRPRCWMPGQILPPLSERGVFARPDQNWKILGQLEFGKIWKLFSGKYRESWKILGEGHCEKFNKVAGAFVK